MDRTQGYNFSFLIRQGGLKIFTEPYYLHSVMILHYDFDTDFNLTTKTVN